MIQLCDKKNLTFVDCWDKIILNSSWEMLISSPKARLITFSKTRLTLSQTTNFRLFQTERVGRRQFQIRWNWQKVLQTGRNHCGKRRNCSLRGISPFPAVFLKDLYCRQNQGLVWERVNIVLSQQLTHDRYYISHMPGILDFARKDNLWCLYLTTDTIWEMKSTTPRLNCIVSREYMIGAEMDKVYQVRNKVDR